MFDIISKWLEKIGGDSKEIKTTMNKIIPNLLEVISKML